MDTQELENLQESLLTIISSLIMEDDKEEISRMQGQALEIISNEGYRKHINDDTKYKYTILDAIKKCSISVGQNYVERRGLAKIEQAIKDAGGKTSEELGRNSSLNEVNDEIPIEILVNALIEAELRVQRRQRIAIAVGSMIGAFLGGMLYSRFSLELGGEESYTYTDSLMNSLISAVCAGAGSFLARSLQNREAIRANLENAAVEQPNIQQQM